MSVFEGDIRDGDFLRKACRGASIVFHIASIIDVTDSVEDIEIYGVNVKGKAVKMNYSNILTELSRNDLSLMDILYSKYKRQPVDADKGELF